MIEFRSINEFDIDAIRQVAQISWGFTYKDIFSQKYINDFVAKNYSQESLGSLIPRVIAGEQFFDIAVNNRKLVGFCNIGLTSKEYRLHRIYLLPEYMGKGVGRKLLDRGKEFVRSKRENRLFCLVHSKNKRGIDFYIQNGFEHVQGRDHGDEWYMEWATH